MLVGKNSKGSSDKHPAGFAINPPWGSFQEDRSDPPAFSYYAKTSVVAVQLVYCHDCQVGKRVSCTVKVFNIKTKEWSLWRRCKDHSKSRWTSHPFTHFEVMITLSLYWHSLPRHRYHTFVCTILQTEILQSYSAWCRNEVSVKYGREGGSEPWGPQILLEWTLRWIFCETCSMTIWQSL